MLNIYNFSLLRNFIWSCAFLHFLIPKYLPKDPYLKLLKSDNNNTKIKVEAAQEKYCKGDSY